MEGAAQARQRLLVARLVGRSWQRLDHDAEHFLRFGDENPEQFGIDVVVGVGHRRHRRLDGGRGLGELERQFAQQLFLGVEREAAARQRAVLRQQVGKEPQGADVLRNIVQRRVLRSDVAGAVGQRAYCVLDVAHGQHGLLLVEDGKRALQAMQHRPGLFQHLAFGRVVVIIVEQFFDLAQARLDLACQHGHGLALLDLARQFALPLRRIGRGFAGGQRQQARADGFGVLRKIVGQLAQLVQAVLDEQHGGRHLQPELVIAPRLHRVARRAAQLTQQLRERRCAQLVAGAGQARQRIVEIVLDGGVGLAVAGDQVPVRLGAGQRFARILQRLRIEFAVAPFGVVVRHRAVQVQGLAQRARFGARRAGGGHEEQRVAQHRLG